MNEAAPSFTLEYVLKEVLKVWTPAAEAIRFRSEMDVRSLAQTSAALCQAGYEVYRADLPMTVSGCAAVVDGRRYILVNRCASRTEQQYAVSHELGHHVLHLNPSPLVEGLGLADRRVEREFQADQFASVWLMWGTKPEKREELLRRNPQIGMVLTVSLMMTIFIVVVPILFYLCSRLFEKFRKPAFRSENQ